MKSPGYSTYFQIVVHGSDSPTANDLLKSSGAVGQCIFALHGGVLK